MGGGRQSANMGAVGWAGPALAPLSIGLDPAKFGTHSLRRTKAVLIYRRTVNLRSVQLLLGDSQDRKHRSLAHSHISLAFTVLIGAPLDFAAKKELTKRDVFLAEMWGGGAVGRSGSADRGHFYVLKPLSVARADQDQAAARIIRSWARKAGGVRFRWRQYCAHLLPAAMVQPVRSRRRRSALRHPVDARRVGPFGPVRRHAEQSPEEDMTACSRLDRSSDHT